MHLRGGRQRARDDFVRQARCSRRPGQRASHQLRRSVHVGVYADLRPSKMTRRSACSACRLMTACRHRQIFRLPC